MTTIAQLEKVAKKLKDSIDADTQQLSYHQNQTFDYKHKILRATEQYEAVKVAAGTLRTIEASGISIKPRVVT